jgi:hypothetical protein
MSTFPHSFEDGRWHTIGELRAWEAELLKEREADQGFSSSVRRATKPHSRQKGGRNKELVPLELFTKHKKMADSTQFRMMPVGHHTDAELVLNGEILKLQFTVTFPCWSGEFDPGHQRALKNEALELHGCIVGTARFRKRRDGTIEWEGGCVSEEERLYACRRGFENAISNKMKHAGSGLTLVIYAQDYVMSIDDASEFSELAHTALENVGFPLFDHVCFLECADDWFVEFSADDFCASASASASA